MNGITKNAIADTLKRMLSERPLSRITVSDICASCGISRMTFYYHFSDIYSLVGWIISSDITAIVSERKTHDTWQEGFLSVFKAVEKNQVFVLNACSSMSREQLERYLSGPVSGLLLSVLEETPSISSISGDDADFIASFYSYAFIGVMLDWIGSGMREKPEELIKRIECVMDGSFERSAVAFSSLRKGLSARNPYRGRQL